MLAGYFCSAGYTETGGMKAFLQRINPDITWERCFPAVDKPNLKKGRMKDTPLRKVSGTSGDHLVERMLDIISQPLFEHDQRYDLILLIDDMDCRFNHDNEAYEDWLLNTFNRVEHTLGRHVLFETLFASPEIETWFISDWGNGFGKEYRDIAVKLRREINALLDTYQNCPEDYGGPLHNGSCTFKISTKIQDIFAQLGNTRQVYWYSKRVNGPAMLNRLEAEEVAKNCARYFRPVYMRLKNLE